MGAPKLKHFPKKTKEEVEKLNANDKRDIELYIQTINEKIKDPEIAKKAARILEQIIKK